MSKDEEVAETGVVDWSDLSPERNMYACLNCPKCGSKYRYPFGEPIMVHCDDCGFKEKARVVNGRED